METVQSKKKSPPIKNSRLLEEEYLCRWQCASECIIKFEQDIFILFYGHFNYTLFAVIYCAWISDNWWFNIVRRLASGSQRSSEPKHPSESFQSSEPPNIVITGKPNSGSRIRFLDTIYKPLIPFNWIFSYTPEQIFLTCFTTLRFNVRTAFVH